MALIEVRDLGVRYPRAPEPSLRGLNFSVERGETLLLLGPSGSGKSTIGLCLAGLIPTSIPARMEGQILLDGRDASTPSVGQRTAMIGMIFQDPEAQFCMLTVDDEVAFGLENLALPREEMEGRIAEALALVGLGSYRRRQVNELSGGQKQRLALACALARRPAILFLDEPTANLDPATRYGFFQLLGTLRHAQPELTLIIVEHVLDDLIAMVDRVLLLGAEGTVHTIGAPLEVFNRQGLELDHMGIWLPQVTALALKLRLAGVPVPHLPLTVEEAAAQLEGLLVHRSADAPTSGAEAKLNHGSLPAISVHDLTFGYRHGQVLRGVSLDVPAQAFFALVGPNGAGKTTLAAHLVEILRPPAGHVRLLGDDIVTLTTAQITERIGYVFQNPEHQFVEQHVEDELAYSLRLRGVAPTVIEATVNQLLQDFGLVPYRKRNPFALSQGQKRRLSVATMLAVGQRVLVLDEPTFGQDRHTAHALMERLCALHASGVTILIITHDMQLVADYARQVAVLLDGEVRFVGATPTLFANEALLREASLRPLPLHELARALGVVYADGTLPMSIRDWFPFFGLARETSPALAEPAAERTP
jgi:energy-coupling factor transport system ATP-binding protein